MKNKDIIEEINFYDYLAPEYGPDLTNHLPMALYALNELGASDQQLQDFAKNHIKQRGIRPLKKKSKIIFTAANYQNFLSSRDYYFAHDRFFKHTMNRDGKKDVLDRHIDFLMSGVCGATFHGLLRTAYGLQAGNDAEISKGLAYWADTYMPITQRTPGLSDNGTSLTELFEEARQLHLKGHFAHITSGSPNIFSKIDAVSNVSEFQDLIKNNPLAKTTTLDDFRSAALHMFQTENCFTTLHCITAAHALRTVFDHVQNKENVLSHAGDAFVATYLSMGAPEIRLTPRSKNIKESDLKSAFEKLCESSNDHAIKLGYTAREEFRDTGNTDYLHIIKDMVAPRTQP